MKRGLRVGLGVLLVVLSLLVSAGVYVGAQLPGEPQATRVEVTPEITGIYAEGAYAWLIVRGDDVVLIDTGLDPEARAIDAELARRGKTPEDVDAVLVTHGHRDHFAAMAHFPNAPVHIGAADHLLVRGDTLPRAPLARLFNRLVKRPAHPREIREVRPAERVEVGALVLDIVATPGHTPGSIMIRFEDVLFSGDSLWLSDDGGVRLAPWFVSDDPKSNAQSLERLEKLAWTGLADGHTGYAADGRQRYEAWLSRRRR